MMIIGICGPMGSGKTTVGKLIEANIDPKFKVHFKPLAKPLKELCKGLGWSGKKDYNGRKLLQTIGHAVRTYVNPDAWVDRWRLSIADLVKDSLNIVIVDDVRYFNEAITILGLRGIVIQIRGHNEPWLPKFLRHSSERYYKDLPYTHIIVNNRSLKELADEVIKILKVENLCPVS